MRDAILDELIGSPGRAEVAYDALMPRKVSNLLLVSSLYDSYTFIEDGRLSEMVFSEFLDLDLRFTPSFERVSTAEEAMERLRQEPYDLVISMTRVGEMNVRQLADAVQAVAPGLPVVLLACSPRELAVLPSLANLDNIDSTYVWQGDVRLFLAIIKQIEDRQNAAHDAQIAGVRSIMLVEDSVQFYSAYLPMLYTEILNQTHALTADTVNRAQRLMRMRARPKVLLARSYEESMRLFERYGGHLLGVIVDAAFPRDGRVEPGAGFDLAGLLRQRVPGLPILMQSDSQNAAAAASLGLEFINKDSPTLLGDLRTFMRKHLGFGDFEFLDPDGSVISRAPDLRTLEWAVRAVPEEHLAANIGRMDFQAWLAARAAFDLADETREIVAGADGDPGEIRDRTLDALRGFRERSMAGVVVDYSDRTFGGGRGFVRFGKGSLGGKGRGLAFINSLIESYDLEHRFPGVRVFVPPTAVLTTEIFDRFMESSGLLAYALQEDDDDRIMAAFLGAQVDRDMMEDLWEYLQWVRYPLAVRSSSLLEDASYQPFAGIYRTFMIPNDSPDPEVRLEELRTAIRRVYASTYHADAKAYMESLPNRLEEEKMAVVVQQVVGRRHGPYLYPDFAGVGRSLNYYPVPGMRPEDGVVSVALGLGKTVVDGGRCVRFCPVHPRKPIQSFTPDEVLENSQRSFLALELSAPGAASARTATDLVSLDLGVAEAHGTLAAVGSVYSPDSDAVYDGLSRPGQRLVTMAGVLKGGVFPLAEITHFLLQVGSAAASCPVEIEFAVSLSDHPERPHEFAFLQIRPMVLGSEAEEIRIDSLDTADALCLSHAALGNGLIHGVRDIVYVRRATFERSLTARVAEEVGGLNATLRRLDRPYLLIGPGRWGSADPWLGIPVRWAQLSGVRCIVETPMEDIHVDPSQGSHFFQNIMSLGIGYLTVGNAHRDDYLDVAWLERQPAAAETGFLRHLSLADPLHIALDGKRNVGVVMKPASTVDAP